VHFVTKNVPTTLDPSRLYFGASATVAAIVIGIAVAGFVLARSHEPVFGRVIRDD
jgi:hypothetical protein